MKFRIAKIFIQLFCDVLFHIFFCCIASSREFTRSRVDLSRDPEAQQRAHNILQEAIIASATNVGAAIKCS